MQEGQPGVDYGKLAGVLETDISLVPFERHPAPLADLEELADRFVRLANRGIDHDAVLNQRMRLAEADWSGLAAPELRAAPRPVQEQAQAVISALAWISGPLWYWRDRVHLFNAAVNRLEQERANAAATRWGVAEDAAEGELLAAREEVERELRQRWWEAYREYIEEGASTVAAMLREGPTESHLGLLQRSPAWSSPEGAVAVFLPTWHANAMERLADELGELVTRINDPSYRPTEEELERLAEVLEQYADDEVFAYHFLSTIGPDGLLQLTGKVAFLQLDQQPDKDLAALVGAVQTGLGVALATATTHTGIMPEGPGDRYVPGRYELPSEWIAELIILGQEELEIVVPYPDDGMTVANPVYGYQLIGVLLRPPQAEYDPYFLRLIGGHMLHFERTAGWSEVGGEGVPIWYDTSQSHGALPLRLNWVDNEESGYDPVIGLLKALNRDPEAARAFFTDEVRFDDLDEKTDDERCDDTDDAQSNSKSTDPITAIVSRVVSEMTSGMIFDPTDNGRLERVNYLLTDRVWPGERVVLLELDNGYSGLDLLGEVLVKATTIDPDYRSHRIVESIIYELATDEEAKGYPNDPSGRGKVGCEQAELFSRSNLIPPVVRDSIARIMTFYIDDMFFNLTQYPPQEDQAGEWEVRANPLHVKRVLADLGKDPYAREQLAVAATIYASATYDYYLSPESGAPTVDERLTEAVQWAGRPLGMIFGALDFGQASAISADQEAGDQEFNRILAGQNLLGHLLFDSFDLAEPVGRMIHEVLDQMERDAQINRTGDTNWQVGEIRELGRTEVELLAHAALYRNLTPDQIATLPEELLRDGEPIPMVEWDDDRWMIWKAHIAERGSEYDEIATAVGWYDLGFGIVKFDLESFR